ncbi:Phage small terminase subunit [Methylomagnum ishizawai]|uniref:Phage small terminase subunit n=1 Tax=Methylomagnum ishizawai TaxID=1760988 RepID=A0A1Y6D0I0_9GAMM|nr:phage terminase small subunit [Methylomagnum ishizawai]SMF96137.1 Phage small terminase subunit [Methylomagnum ishizawai]
MSTLDKIKAKRQAARESAAQSSPPPDTAARPPLNPLDLLRAKRGAVDPAGADLTQDEPTIPEAAPPRPAAPPPGTLQQYQDAIDAAQAAWQVHPALSEGRTEAKRKLLLQIMPFVEAYIADGAAYPNSVAVEAMILLLDTGDIERGLSLGLILAAQDCHIMPKRFQGKNLRHQVVRLTLDWAIAQLKAAQPAAPYLDQLLQAMDTEPGRWELNPILRGEAYALAAKHAAQAQDWPAGVDWCLKAQAANPKGAGVKTLLNQCLAAANNEGAPAQETAQP